MKIRKVRVLDRFETTEPIPKEERKAMKEAHPDEDIPRCVHIRAGRIGDVVEVPESAVERLLAAGLAELVE